MSVQHAVRRQAPPTWIETIGMDLEAEQDVLEAAGPGRHGDSAGVCWPLERRASTWAVGALGQEAHRMKALYLLA
jgi:hypothetical protein